MKTIINILRFIIIIHIIYILFFIPNNWLPYMGHWPGDFIIDLRYITFYLPFTSSVCLLLLWLLLDKIEGDSDTCNKS